MLEKLLQWDQETLVYLNSIGAQQFDTFWLTITSFVTWIPLFILMIFLILRNYGKQRSGWVLLSYISMLTILVITILLTKHGVARLRPVNDPSLQSLLRIVIQPNDYSFFSGHAASSFSIAVLTLLYLRKKTKWMYFILIWPLLFSFSRMYLGVHYPLDIAVGTIVGILFALLFYRMHKKFKAPYI